MNRRENLKLLAACTASTLRFTTAAGLIAGCRWAEDSYVPEILSHEQRRLLKEMTALIIPETDTPGAKTARVDQFIDHMLARWHTEEERQHFLAGLDAVNQQAADCCDGPFLALDRQEQLAVLTRLEEDSTNSHRDGTDKKLSSFFGMLKHLTLVGYYTSEAGATKALASNTVPGAYHGCIGYSEIGRAWSET